MIIALILPIAMPIVGLICLMAAYFPNQFSRFLLILTGWLLLLLTVLYVAIFILGIL